VQQFKVRCLNVNQIAYLHSKNAGSSVSFYFIFLFFHRRAHNVTPNRPIKNCDIVLVTLYIFIRRHFANVKIGIGLQFLIL